MFKNEDDFKNIINRLNIDDKPNADHRQNLHRQVLSTFNQIHKPRKTTWLTIRRIIVKSPITKFAAAAAIIIVGALAITFLQQSATPAYAIEQTIEAFKNVRYMHIIRRDETGLVEDERWIEIGPDGFQTRYRQDTPLHGFFVVDNRETVLVHYKNKNTVVLYDPSDQSYTWHYAPGKLFEELVNDQLTLTIEEHIDYWDRPAHRVRSGGMEFYIDPETKLPMAGGGYQMSYENPPEGTFDIVIPNDVVVVDKRPSAEPAQEPEWMDEDKVAQSNFDEARRALAAGEYLKAVDFFRQVIEIQPGRNWAWFWLGRTYYELGEYDLAVSNFSKVLDMMGDAAFCLYARGLAFAAAGMQVTANEDLEKVLPTMILALRHIEAVTLFDLADDPLRCADGFLDEDCHEGPNKEQNLAMMINRLRVITGQNFGYDPDASAQENEQAIAAWEDWYEKSGEIKFTPDTELVPIPPVLE